MNAMDLVSVIVPVYNVESFLKRCLDSLVNQTYKNLDIILIDDGSTDNSGALCDEYVSKDNRFRVIHKENGGLSDARNVGIEKAQGQYITCIDSDDFVSKYYIENLYFAIKQSGSKISCCGFIEYHDNDVLSVDKRVSNKDVVILDRVDFYEKMLYQRGMEVTVCAKMYDAVVFDDVRFPKGRLYEDTATIYKLVEKTETIVVIPNLDYFYYQRTGSIVRSEFNPRKMDFITYTAEMCSYLVDKYPELEKAAKSRYYSACCNVLFQIPKGTFENEEKYIWNEMKSIRREILFDRNSRKKNRWGALLSFLGIRVMRIVYNIVSQ